METSRFPSYQVIFRGNEALTGEEPGKYSGK